MAEKLVAYYAFAKARGGLMLQMKLAMRTSLSEPKAAAAPDSPELLDRFYRALRALLGDDPSIPAPR